MDLISESEPDIDSKKAIRTSCDIIPRKRCRYLKDADCTEDTDPDASVVSSDTGPVEVPSDIGPVEVPSNTTDLPGDCIPRLSGPQNSIKELPTSDNRTTNSPQDSGELVFRPAIESPDGSETNQPESSNGDSITDASENTPELFDYSVTPDGKRTRRTSKRKKDIDECCPVCGITVRFPELESHLAQEIEKLSSIPRRFKKTIRNDNGISTTYVQVKSNRENRLTAKVAQYAVKPLKEIQCPVCKVHMTGSIEEVNNHVDMCLQSDEHVNVDEDDDSSYEEYEIGDETRIRAISLVPGGYRSLQGQSSHRSRDDDLDVDVEVDVDDTITYGQPQYTELDVLSIHSQDIDEAQDQLRKSVLVDLTAQPKVLESRKWCKNAGEEDESKVEESKKNQLDLKQEKNDDSSTEEKEPSNQVISALKEKIKDLDQSNDVKCLICLEPYTKPVVSVTCWHVYCEECWLMTMGVKKLCPQCNMIVFPGDLRKIYL